MTESIATYFTAKLPASQPVSHLALPTDCALHSTFIEEIFSRDCTIAGRFIISPLSPSLTPYFFIYLYRSLSLSLNLIA